MTRTYATAEKAAAAWIRHARRDGRAESLGGGWFRIGRGRPRQGLGNVARWLAASYWLHKDPDGYRLDYRPPADTEAARLAAANAPTGAPCRICKRPTLAPSGVCDRHGQTRPDGNKLAR